MSTSENTRKQAGRLSIGPGKQINVRIHPELAARIDAWRVRQDDAPGRPEAIRRIVEQALAR